MEKQSIELRPGEEAVFECRRAAVMLTIAFEDGTKIKVPVGPGGNVFYTKGFQMTPTITFDPPDRPLGDLKIIDLE